jgi:hypothetical protein
MIETIIPATEINETEQQHPPATASRLRMNAENLPFGHVCDDIAVDNDTPYVRVLEFTNTAIFR